MVSNLNYPYTFEGGQKAVASEVNANFDAIKLYANSINTEIQSIQTAIGKLEEKPTREMFDIYFSVRGETPTGAYPLWTGETITNCKLLYPEFWKELTRLAQSENVPTVTNEEYEEKLEEYGQCASFYIDELNGHVRLPKITRFISSIADLSEIAKEENSVNTAHTHNLKAYTGSGNRNASKDRYLGSGTDNSKSDMFWSDTTDIENEAVVVSNGEEEGHPKNVKLYLYIQVVNNTAELSTFDVDALKKQYEEYLAGLEEAYNGYMASLQTEFNSIKGQIANEAKTYKYTNIVVPVEDFVADETYADYGYKADIELVDADDDLIATVNFSLEDAQSGNYAPVNLCGEGIVTIYAKEVPESLTIPSILIQ